MDIGEIPPGLVAGNGTLAAMGISDYHRDAGLLPTSAEARLLLRLSRQPILFGVMKFSRERARRTI